MLKVTEWALTEPLLEHIETISHHRMTIVMLKWTQLHVNVTLHSAWNAFKAKLSRYNAYVDGMLMTRQLTLHWSGHKTTAAFTRWRHNMHQFNSQNKMNLSSLHNLSGVMARWRGDHRMKAMNSMKDLWYRSKLYTKGITRLTRLMTSWRGWLGASTAQLLRLWSSRVLKDKKAAHMSRDCTLMRR